MPHSNRLKIFFEVKDKEVKRTFDSSFKNSIFGRALQNLVTKKNKRSIAAALPNTAGIVRQILSSDFKLFVNPQDMPWYLDLIAHRLIDAPGPYRITIKACRDYTFFDVSFMDKKSGRRKLLLSPFFHETPLPKSMADKELVRGLADTFLFLAPNFEQILEEVGKDKKSKAKDKNAKIKNMITDAIDWCCIELDTEEIKPKKPRGTTARYELEFTANVDWNYSAVKKHKKSITIFNQVGDTQHVIVSSKNIRKAIGDLSEAWHNPAAGSILLSAWTGSGKDILQDVLAYALSVNDIQTIPLQSPQLGPDKPLEGIREAIESRGLIEKKTVNGKCDLTKAVLLFLDEIHHESAQPLREQLLRVLEAKELISSKTTISFEQVRCLFAASEPPEKLRAKKPPDFWTRIEYTIVMNHPLLLETRREKNETLQQFFCVFWRGAATKRRQKALEPQTTAIVDYLCPKTNDEYIVGELSKVFSDSLDSPLIHAISIRLLRSIVNRLFSKTVYFIRTEKLKENEKMPRIKGEMDRWIIQLFNNIVPEIKPEGVF